MNGSALKVVLSRLRGTLDWRRRSRGQSEFHCQSVRRVEKKALQRAFASFAAAWLLAGCAAITDRQSLGYGDYVGYSCEQLGQEALRLMRIAADKSEHLVVDDRTRRESALNQLSLVKRATADKAC